MRQHFGATVHRFVDGCTALMRPRIVIRADAHLLASRYVFSQCFLLTAVSEERHGIPSSC